VPLFHLMVAELATKVEDEAIVTVVGRNYLRAQEDLFNMLEQLGVELG